MAYNFERDFGILPDNEQDPEKKKKQEVTPEQVKELGGIRLDNLPDQESYGDRMGQIKMPENLMGMEANNSTEKNLEVVFGDNPVKDLAMVLPRAVESTAQGALGLIHGFEDHSRRNMLKFYKERYGDDFATAIKEQGMFAERYIKTDPVTGAVSWYDEEEYIRKWRSGMDTSFKIPFTDRTVSQYGWLSNRDDILGTPDGVAPALIQGVADFGIVFAKSLSMLGTKRLSESAKIFSFHKGKLLPRLNSTSKLSYAKRVAMHSKEYGKIMGAGFVADTIAFGPYDARMADMLEEFGWMKNAFTEYLKSNKDDSILEGLLKNGLEGLLAGPIFDSVLTILAKGMKGLALKSELVNVGVDTKEGKRILKDLQGKEFDIDSDISFLAEKASGFNRDEWLANMTFANAVGLDPTRVKVDLDGNKINAKELAKAEAYGQISGNKPKGYTTPMDSFGRVWINVLKRGDSSTFIHEVGHAIRATLFSRADKNMIAPGFEKVYGPDGIPVGVTQEMVDTIALSSGLKESDRGADGQWKWNEAAEENFAEALEKYVLLGRAPKDSAKGINKAFQTISSVMKTVYKNGVGEQLVLTPAMKGVFDKLMSRSDIPFVDARRMVDDSVDIDDVFKPEGSPFWQRTYGLGDSFNDYTIEVKNKKLSEESAPTAVNKTFGKSYDKVVRNINHNIEQIGDPLNSESEWEDSMIRFFGGEDRVPKPPTALINDFMDGGNGMVSKLKKLTPAQLKSVNDGLATTLKVKESLKNPTDMTRLIYWAILSNNASPFVQEGAFLDTLKDIDTFINKARSGEFDIVEYMDWADRVVPAGVGRAGASSRMNINTFGSSFLTRTNDLAREGKDVLSGLFESWKTKSSHEFLLDYYKHYEGAGLDNKLINFARLAGGHHDVVVMDRIQTRAWMDVDNFQDMMQPFGKAQGVAMYKALSKGIESKLPKIYSKLGRNQDDATLGRFHWENWVLNGEDEVAHETLKTFFLGTKYADGIREGKLDSYQYGHVYGPEAGSMDRMVPVSRVFGEDNYAHLTHEQSKEVLSDFQKSNGIPQKMSHKKVTISEKFKLASRTDKSKPWNEQNEVYPEELEYAALLKGGSYRRKHKDGFHTIEKLSDDALTYLRREHRYAKSASAVRRLRDINDKNSISSFTKREKNEGTPRDVLAEYAPTDVTKKIFKRSGLVTSNIFEVRNTEGKVRLFLKEAEKDKSPSPNGLKAEDFEGARMFISRDRSSGIAVSPSGKAVAFFNNGRNGHSLLRVAIEEGGMNGGLIKGIVWRRGYRSHLSAHGIKGGNGGNDNIKFEVNHSDRSYSPSIRSQEQPLLFQKSHTTDGRNFFFKTWEGLQRFNDNDKLAQVKKAIGGKEIEWDMVGLNSLLHANPDATVGEAKANFIPINIREHHYADLEHLSETTPLYSTDPAHQTHEHYGFEGDPRYASETPRGPDDLSVHGIGDYREVAFSIDNYKERKERSEETLGSGIRGSVPGGGHGFPSNTFAHARYAFLRDEKGRKILHAFELQSDWASKRARAMQDIERLRTSDNNLFSVLMAASRELPRLADEFHFKLDDNFEVDSDWHREWTKKVSRMSNKITDAKSDGLIKYLKQNKKRLEKLEKLTPIGQESLDITNSLLELDPSVIRERMRELDEALFVRDKIVGIIGSSSKINRSNFEVKGDLNDYYELRYNFTAEAAADRLFMKIVAKVNPDSNVITYDEVQNFFPKYSSNRFNLVNPAYPHANPDWLRNLDKQDIVRTNFDDEVDFNFKKIGDGVKVTRESIAGLPDLRDTYVLKAQAIRDIQKYYVVESEDNQYINTGGIMDDLEKLIWPNEWPEPSVKTMISRISDRTGMPPREVERYVAYQFMEFVGVDIIDPDELDGDLLDSIQRVLTGEGESDILDELYIIDYEDYLYERLDEENYQNFYAQVYSEILNSYTANGQNGAAQEIPIYYGTSDEPVFDERNWLRTELEHGGGWQIFHNTDKLDFYVSDYGPFSYENPLHSNWVEHVVQRLIKIAVEENADGIHFFNDHAARKVTGLGESMARRIYGQLVPQALRKFAKRHKLNLEQESFTGYTVEPYGPDDAPYIVFNVAQVDNRPSSEIDVDHVDARSFEIRTPVEDFISEVSLSGNLSVNPRGGMRGLDEALFVRDKLEEVAEKLRNDEEDFVAQEARLQELRERQERLIEEYESLPNQDELPWEHEAEDFVMDEQAYWNIVEELQVEGNELSEDVFRFYTSRTRTDAPDWEREYWERHLDLYFNNDFNIHEEGSWLIQQEPPLRTVIPSETTKNFSVFGLGSVPIKADADISHFTDAQKAQYNKVTNAYHKLLTDSVILEDQKSLLQGDMTLMEFLEGPWSEFRRTVDEDWKGLESPEDLEYFDNVVTSHITLWGTKKQMGYKDGKLTLESLIKISDRFSEIVDRSKSSRIGDTELRYIRTAEIIIERLVQPNSKPFRRKEDPVTGSKIGREELENRDAFEVYSNGKSRKKYFFPDEETKKRIQEPTPLYQKERRLDTPSGNPAMAGVNPNNISDDASLNAFIRGTMRSYEPDEGPYVSVEEQQGRFHDAYVNIMKDLGEDVSHQEIARLIEMKGENLQKSLDEIGAMRGVQRKVAENFKDFIETNVTHDGEFIGDESLLLEAMRLRQGVYEVSAAVRINMGKVARTLGSFGQKAIDPKETSGGAMGGEDRWIPKVQNKSEATQILEREFGGADNAKLQIMQDYVYMKMNPNSYNPKNKKFGFAPAVMEFWMNNILSGIQSTHVANMVGGLVAGPWTRLERAFGAAVQGDKQLVKRELQELGLFFTNIFDALKIAGYTFADGKPRLDEDNLGTIEGKHSDFNQISAFGATHFTPGSRKPQINSEGKGVGVIGKAYDWLGNIVNIPSRLLMSEDEWMKQMNYRSRMIRRIYDIADNKFGNPKGELKRQRKIDYIARQIEMIGESGEQYSLDLVRKRMDEKAKSQGIKKGTPEYTQFMKTNVKMHFDKDVLRESSKAVELAERNTFTNKLDTDASASGIFNIGNTERSVSSPLDPNQKASMSFGEASGTLPGVRSTINRMSEGMAKLGNEHAVLKFIFPFIKTPTNILQFALDRTTGALSDSLRLIVDKNARQAYSVEGRADLAGRAATGVVLISTAYAMANQTDEKGRPVLTGAGPVNKNERAVWKAMGIQPYSRLINGRYYSYKKLDPAAIPIGIVCDIVQLTEYQEAVGRKPELLKGFFVGLTNNLIHKSYLSGMFNASRALSDPYEYGGQFIERMASGFVPYSGLMGQLPTNDTLKEVRSILDSGIERIPFLREDLPDHRDLFGDPIKKSKPGTPLPFGAHIPGIGAMPYTELDDDPVKLEMFNIGSNQSRPTEIQEGVDLTAFKWGKTKFTAYDKMMEYMGTIKVEGPWGTKSLKSALAWQIRQPSYQALSSLGTDDIESPRDAKLGKIFSKFKKEALKKVKRQMPEVDNAIEKIKKTKSYLGRPGYGPERAEREAMKDLRRHWGGN